MHGNGDVSPWHEPESPPTLESALWTPPLSFDVVRSAAKASVGGVLPSEPWPTVCASLRSPASRRAPASRGAPASVDWLFEEEQPITPARPSAMAAAEGRCR